MRASIRKSIFAALAFWAFLGAWAATPASALIGSTNEPGVTFGPGDYSRFNLSVRDPNVCRNYCLNDPNCRAWTYQRFAYTGTGTPACSLYTYVPRRGTNNCCISGVKTTTSPPPITSPAPWRQTLHNPRWSNGIAVDWCLTYGASCGFPAAHYYCRWRGYSQATAYTLVRTGHTYVAGANQICRGAFCTAFSTVTCQR